MDHEVVVVWADGCYVAKVVLKVVDENREIVLLPLMAYACRDEDDIDIIVDKALMYFRRMSVNYDLN